MMIKHQVWGVAHFYTNRYGFSMVPPILTCFDPKENHHHHHHHHFLIFCGSTHYCSSRRGIDSYQSLEGRQSRLHTEYHHVASLAGAMAAEGYRISIRHRFLYYIYILEILYRYYMCIHRLDVRMTIMMCIYTNMYNIYIYYHICIIFRISIRNI